MVNKLKSFLILLILLSVFSCTDKKIENSNDEKSNSGYVKNDTDNLKQVVNKLKSAGVDTLVIYERVCKREKPSSYIFWASKGKHFICNVTEADEVKTVDAGISLLVATAVVRFEDIKEAEIKQASHTIGDKVMVPINEHLCMTRFFIQVSSKEMQKKIDHFDLETKKVNKNAPSDNYLNNQRSILNFLKKEAEREVETFHKIT